MKAVTTLNQSLSEVARRFADEQGTVFLHSGSGYDSAQNSYLFLSPIETVHTSNLEELKKIVKLTDSHLPDWVGYLAYEGEGVWMRHQYFLHDDGKQVYFYSRDGSTLPDPPPADFDPTIQVKLTACSDTQESYDKKIRQAKQWILDGEIYQLNLSQQFTYEGEFHPFTLFEKIVERNPAPFMAYMNFEDHQIISSSPERLLSHVNGKLETRPIKGTAPRGNSPEEDRECREKLLCSEKDRSELLMITDLMRNDLGKVSKTGSVQVKDLWRCETYTNVFHLLSIIQSEAKRDLHPVEILEACFPGGSITGCPKIRAMELIGELEQRKRGIYTGSIGYFSGNGDFDFNIAIRTLFVKGKKIDLQLGGAIVYDSDPEQEWKETLYKGASLFQSLNQG